MLSELDARKVHMKHRLPFSGLLVLVVTFSLIACSTQAHSNTYQTLATSGPGSTVQTAGTGNDTFDPVISRNVPAFASSGVASDANDSSYDTLWWSTTTNAWLAYDLSRTPASERNNVLVVWYNDSYDYNNTVMHTAAYNVPEDYTIDVNPAPGGNTPPTTGWVTRVKVQGNTYHSRQHIVNMTGDNWIRIYVTGVNGSAENYSVRINMDVYDASYALTDDWIFYGDSITAGSMGNNSVNGVPGFAELIHARIASRLPVQEDGGIGFLASADGVKYIHTWLSIFPGKYVVLSYGTNDANACVAPTTFYNNFVMMVEAILHAGKIPVIPHLPWGRTPNIQQCGPPLNSQIDALYKAFPQIIKGPDLWSYFQAHQDFISSDNIHPTQAGIAAYREQWVGAMLHEVYGL